MQNANVPQRSSNIELLRIVAMFMIVLHHYCVNSGFTELIDPRNITGNMIFIQFMSIGGKVGVNIFFLISGYFMLRGQLKWSKVLQLVFQIFSINVIVCLFLSLLGYDYGFKDYLRIIPLVMSVPTSFISSYMVIYVMSPIINKTLVAFDRKEFEYMLAVLLVFFCLLQTFLNQNTWHYMGWAFTMYCVGAYIRKYELTALKWHFGWIAIVLTLITWGAIICINYAVLKIDSLPPQLWNYAIADANKLNMFMLGVAIFMYFAKLNIRHCKLINYMGRGIAFGVLLWHANNNHMRQWLWKDFLKNTEYLSSDYLWLHCLVSVVGVYIICTLLELLRHHLIEKPLFSKINRRKDSVDRIS